MPAAMSPPREHVGAARVLELIGEFEQSAQQSRAIVVSEIDEPGLDDEAAKFDQMVSALAALHDPGSRIEARGDGFSVKRRSKLTPDRRPILALTHIW
jgi:hypothetical protein